MTDEWPWFVEDKKQLGQQDLPGPTVFATRCDDSAATIIPKRMFGLSELALTKQRIEWVHTTYLNVEVAFGKYLVLTAFFELSMQHDLAYFEIRVRHILSFGQQRFVRNFQLHLGLFLFRELPFTRLDHNEFLF